MAAEKLQDEVEMLAAELKRSKLQRDELEKQNRVLRENLGSLISVVERTSCVAESAIINLQKKVQDLQENLHQEEQENEKKRQRVAPKRLIQEM